VKSIAELIGEFNTLESILVELFPSQNQIDYITHRQTYVIKEIHKIIIKENHNEPAAQ
jgi:hypothetical protein